MSEKLKNHNPRLDFRPSTIEDIVDMTGISSLKNTVRAMTFLLDGEVSGIGGVKYESGYYVAFSDIKPDIDVSAATVARCGLEVMKMIKSMGVQVLAVKSTSSPGADRFLKFLGFEDFQSSPEGDVYLWRS